jgi:glycerophosphoryl diester phosphodiesterase
VTGSGFDLQGHRGVRGLAPENTLLAFDRALALGVTTLEMDLAVTRDGAVVVSHDSLLNPDITRDSAGRWIEKAGPAIVTLTHEELLKYDVGRIRPGTAYAVRFPDQVGADGVRVPTLTEVYALTRRARNDTVRFNVETKLDPTRPDETVPPNAFVDAVVAVIREHGMEKRTTIQSFDWRTLRRVKEVAPEIETVCLTVQGAAEDNVRGGKAGRSAWLGGLDVDDYGGSVPKVAKAAGCSVWSPAFANVDRVRVAEAHAFGLKVVPWTINDTATMAAQIAMGIDGLISDRPDLALALLKGSKRSQEADPRDEGRPGDRRRTEIEKDPERRKMSHPEEPGRNQHR